MKAQDLTDLLADPVDRIQRGHGFLENHRDVVAPHPAHPGFIEFQQVLVFKPDFAPGDKARGFRYETHDRQGCHAFAASGLAHQTHGLTLVDFKINAGYRFYYAIIGPEVGVQVLDF